MFVYYENEISMEDIEQNIIIFSFPCCYIRKKITCATIISLYKVLYIGKQGTARCYSHNQKLCDQTECILSVSFISSVTKKKKLYVSFLS